MFWKKFLSICIAFFAVVLALFLLLYLLEHRSSSETPKSDFIFITVESLRPEFFLRTPEKKEKSLIPHLEALAQDSIVFNNVITSSPLSLPSSCSLLTGKYPMAHGVRNNLGFRLDSNQDTLAELFQKEGYQSAAFIGSRLFDKQTGISQGFSIYDDAIPHGYFERPASLVLKKAQDWILQKVLGDQNQVLSSSARSPFFLWIPLYDLHLPHRSPEPLSPEDPQPQNAYQGELLTLDKQLGLFFQFLKELELYENTIIVVVGNQGESLGEHQEVAAGYFLYESTIKVPLILKLPNNRYGKKVITQPVRSIDLFPTSLKIIGASIPATCQGIELTSLFEEERPLALESYSESYLPFYQYGASPLKMLRTEQFKYIQGGKKELYHLLNDPEEKQNIIGKNPQMDKEWERKLEVVMKSYQQKNESAPPLESFFLKSFHSMGVTSEILEQIRQGDVPEGVLPPAQDYFKYHLAFYETENALQQQNYSSAQEHLDIVLKQYPWMPYVHELQIQILMALERYDQATLWLKTLLQVRPKDTSSLFKLALCYEKQGQFTEAIALLQNLIMEFPDFSKAREALWKLYLKTKQEQVLLQEASLLIQKNSQDPKTWFWIGEAQQGLEKYSQALKSYKNALPDPSLHFEASGEIASLYLKLKNLPKAQETLKQLLEESQERLNKALIQSQRPEERALEVREATENLVETYFHCGIILEEERYYSEALHYFLTGLDQDPHHWPCQKKILEMYLLLEKKEEAFVLIQDLLQEDLLIEKKVRLASYLQEIQKESEALALLQSLAQKAPENPWVWMQYGKYFWKQGTPEKARPLFLKFLELHPKEDHYRQEIQALLQESEPEKEK